MKKNKSQWQYKSAPEYNVYYSGGDNSIYHKLYKDKFIPYDKWLLEKTALEIAKNKEELKIIDFGCGNGRYLPIFHEIALTLNKQNKRICLFAYDPSQEALSFFYNRLENLGFTLRSAQSNPSKNSKFSVVELIKDNMVVKLVKPDEYDISDLDKITGMVDITACMFGVLSHIQTRAERINVIKQLNNLTDRKLFISVPSYRILTKERKAFELIRASRFQLQINYEPLILEKGDVLYARNDKGLHVANFLHLYESADEIMSEAIEAGVEVAKNFQINRIFHETKLIRYPLLGILDKFLCRLLSAILPAGFKNKIAGYYLISRG